jgi:hypothetical protein
MTRDFSSRTQSQVNSVVLGCIAAALTAFAAALIGFVSTDFPSRSLVAVGMFYLAIATISRIWTTDRYGVEQSQSLDQKASVRDLIGESIPGTRHLSTPSSDIVGVP